MLHLFLDASVRPDSRVGAYGLTTDLVMNSTSSTMAELELFRKVLESLDRTMITAITIYTNCQTLVKFHTEHWYYPKLLKHRNYTNIYKPLLDLLEPNVTIVKVKGHAPGRGAESKTSTPVERIFSRVDKGTRRHNCLIK